MRRLLLIVAIIVFPTMLAAHPTVYLKNLGTGTSYSAIAGPGGKFTFSNVEPGSYTILLMAPQNYFQSKAKQAKQPLTAQNIKWYPMSDSASLAPKPPPLTPPAANQVVPMRNGTALGISYTSEMLNNAVKDPITALYYVVAVSQIQIVVSSMVEGEVVNTVL